MAPGLCRFVGSGILFFACFRVITEAMNKKHKERQRQQAPIKDGDARPDMPADDGAKNKRRGPGSSGKFGKERMGDVNSLEDYKDARPENNEDSGQHVA